MFFASLILHNVFSRKVRSLLTGFAIAVSIMTVVTMGVLTHSLRESAVAILRTGTADFSVAQANVTDVLYSSVDEKDLQEIRSSPDIQDAVGVLVAPYKLDDNHPFFLRIGVAPEDLDPFGVHVLSGRLYDAKASDQIMLGYRAARELNRGLGDRITIDQDTYQVVGIYSTGQVFGDSGSMVPLVALQASERKPGTITLAFVHVKPGADIATVRQQIQSRYPELATVRSESDFGHVDRNLDLLGAANTGVSALALILGAVTVLNMMVLSVFERTREFGVLRAMGWSRGRIVSDVMGEALIVTFLGAGVGIAAGFGLIRLLRDTPALKGLFIPALSADVFVRALLIAFGMAVFGALYPALRAAFLRPLTAIRHE